MEACRWNCLLQIITSMAITLIENQAINFRLESESEDCSCNKKRFCQKVNNNDVGKFQVISTSIIQNGDFNNPDGWEFVDVLNVNTFVVNESFNGDCDGSITVTATGGDSNYEYSIDGVNFQISNLFDDLCQGCYNIVVKDGNGALGFAYACIGKSVDCSSYNTPELFDLLNTTLNDLINCELNDLL
jgi:hypothetical protein